MTIYKGYLTRETVKFIKENRNYYEEMNLKRNYNGIKVDKPNKKTQEQQL